MKATIKVRMNRTTQGAPDSTTVRTYLEGEEYDIPEDLAECFFSDGAADPAEAHEGADAQEGAGDEGDGAATHAAPKGKTPATRKPRGKGTASKGDGA